MQIKTKRLNYLLLIPGALGVLLIANSLVLAFMQGGATPEEIGLIEDWHLSGNKSVSTRESESIPYLLKGKNTLAVTYDLQGLCLLGNDASAIVLEQEGKAYSVSLSQYGENCFDGEQTIHIPLGHFEGFDVNRRLEKIGVSFWYPTHYSVSIKQAVAYKAEGNVLGDSVRPDYSKLRKVFPNITPIRRFPYASQSSEEL
jgi:hypothetical protein